MSLREAASDGCTRLGSDGERLDGTRANESAYQVFQSTLCGAKFADNRPQGRGHEVRSVLVGQHLRPADVAREAPRILLEETPYLLLVSPGRPSPGPSLFGSSRAPILPRATCLFLSRELSHTSRGTRTSCARNNGRRPTLQAKVRNRPTSQSKVRNRPTSQSKVRNPSNESA